jgi:outer membrane protein assembly factor BamA
MKTQIKAQSLSKIAWKPAIAILALSSFWALSVGLSATPVQAQGLEESETVQVVEVQVTGNEHISTREILDVLPFKAGDEITLPDDLLRAENKLKALGIFRDVVADYRRAEGGIVVILDVFENPVIEKIEITGNRDWNEDRRLTIPWLGISLRWPFTHYLVETDRLLEILKQNGVEEGRVLNVVKLRKALGVSEQGACLPNPPAPSICREYKDKGYFLFGISKVETGETLRIEVLEGVIERIEIEGVSDVLRDEALKLLKDLPLNWPVKLTQFQTAIQRVNKSVFFEPLRPEDVKFKPGSALHRLVLVLKLKERRILDQPTVIEGVQFVGNTVFSEGELLRRVHLPKRETLDNYELLKALSSVYRLYRTEGYFLVKFSLEKIENGVLILRIDEGRIGEIEIKQNGYLTARFTPKGIELLPLPTGEEASPEAATPAKGPQEEQNVLLQVLQNVAEFLGNFLGTTNPGSLPRTQPEIVVKELTVQPGDLVNQYRLADTYRKLLGLGYFSEVNFNFEPLEGGEIKLIVDVKENQKTGSLNGALSFTGEGIVGQVSLSGKNLYGTGQDLSLNFNSGILGKAQVNFTLDYTNRTLLEAADYVQVKLFNNTSQEKSPKPHVLQRIGGEISLAYPWEGFQVVAGLRHESFTKDFESEGETPEIERGLTQALSVTVNQDDRNNPIFATRGGLRSFRIERAGLLGLGTEFTKLQMTLIQHFPTLENQTIALRFVGGLGVDLPSQEEFLLGGSTTLRGIKTARTPSMAFLNAEYRVQIIQGVFSIALFADVGSGVPFELKKSIGIEGRVNVPYLGWVRLAFAWPITDRIEYLKVEYGFGSFF